MKNGFYILFLSILFAALFSKAEAATFIVDRLDDVAGATACTAAANDCSLRGAIINANANGAGADTINFNVGGGNAQTIIMSSTPLPDIQTSLTIDGTTQPLWSSLPIIEINGAASAANTNGFKVSSPVGNIPLTVTIKGLIINRFTGSGIFFNTDDGVTATVSGCYIGTSAGGGTDLGNSGDGIRISADLNSSFTIGGFSSNAERNVISGNQGNGIQVTTALNIFQTAQTNVFVYNNFIGTTAAGNSDLGNSGDGIRFGGPGFGYSLNVGTGSSSARNIISGNGGNGIWMNSGSAGIYGNFIGTGLNGNSDIGNTLNGIALEGTVNAVIGGTLLGFNAGNTVSGNNQNGISINDAGVSATIRRNLIGTNAAGTSAIGNSQDGINIFEPDTSTASAIIIGSSANVDDGNTISGNGEDGIDVGDKANGVKIYANRIGLNAAAGGTIPNAFAGIRVLSADNEIGLADNNTAANLVSGNSIFGIMLVGASSTGNKIYNNFIGTNAGDANLGNGGSGIYLNQSASNNKIGSGTAGGANRIAFNSGNGITVANGQDNAIRANSVYSNSELGIDLDTVGVTPNDTGDDDAGANDRQNFPVLLRATPSRITGFLNVGQSLAPYRIDFYRVDSCDASGFGEGRYYLGSQTVASVPGSADASIGFPTSLTVGQFVTATATFDQDKDTSEFSQCRTVTGEPGNFSFSAAAYTANENSGARTIVINRSGGSTGAITFFYVTSDGTATAGLDYGPQNGPITFLDGEVVKSFDIPITNDLLDEPDETVNLALTSPPAGVFFTPNQNATLTILDDDAPPTVEIVDVSQAEGNLGLNQFSFRVQLSAPSGKPISIDYQTAGGTATASVDFIPTNGTINFNPGETLKNFLVPVISDLTPELDETFSANLSNPQNAVFGDNQAQGAILDDDRRGQFAFSLAPYSGTEHNAVMITVSRTNGTAGTVSVDYATGGGTALPISDYTPVSGTLIFADGETSKTFFVNLTDDAMPEPAESVNVVLSNPIGGASLGVPAVAVLNIFDNDSGTLYAINGEVKLANNSPVAGVTMTLQGATSATTQTDASGRFSFPNLAPNGNYTVTPSALGYTFNPLNRQYNNLSADITNANFTATATPVRQLRVIGGNAAPTQNITANIELVAQGDENSIGFSLNYDSAILMNPQAAPGADAGGAFLTVNTLQTGKIGVLAALPAGQTFTAGTKQIITLTFNTAPTNAFNSPVTFGDIPIVKQVVNANADALPTNYLDGAVTFAQGFESDVAPRPTGNNNGTVTIADFTQVGRFVAGLDALNANFNEFQRADAAPRITRGNGSLTVSDYTQAGRYAAGLDAAAPTGGENAPNLGFGNSDFGFQTDSQSKIRNPQLQLVPTNVRVVNTQAAPGQQVVVSIAADAGGTENGFGFSVNYDSTKLSNPLVAKGADTQSATLIPNTNQTGRIGVILAMPAGQSVTAGTRQIITITFNVAPNAAGGNSALIFGDIPAFREVSDVDANVLPSNFTDGAINILAPTSASVSVSGKVADAGGRPISRALVSMILPSGEQRTTRTSLFGFYRFDEIPAGASCVVEVRHKKYRFAPRIITVFEAMENVDLVALE